MTAPSAGSGSTHPPGHPGTGGPPPPPPPTKGHLPIGAPRLGEVIRDAERLSAQLLSVLDRDYDVDSAPSAEDDPTGLGFIEVRLLCARADARSIQKMLEQITTLGLPPAGSAVQFPGPSDSSACLSGGSASHPASTPGECLSPGYVGSVCGAPDGSDLAGVNHLTAPSVAVSGGLLPGLVDATPTAVDIDESVAPDAGESSGPWEVNASQSPVSCAGATPATGAGPSTDPIASGSRAAVPAPAGSVSEVAQQATGKAHRTGGDGVGFTLPVTERFTMPGTERIARSINKALTGRSW